MKFYQYLTTALCAALLFTACSAPGKTPVAVSDPVSSAAATGQIVEDYDFRFIDRTAEKIAECKTYDYTEGHPTPALPRPEFLPTQDIAKKVGELCQSALGMDLSAQLDRKSTRLNSSH